MISYESGFEILASAFAEKRLPADTACWDLFGPKEMTVSIEEVLNHFVESTDQLTDGTCILLGLPPASTYAEGAAEIWQYSSS